MVKILVLPEEPHADNSAAGCRPVAGCNDDNDDSGLQLNEGVVPLQDAISLSLLPHLTAVGFKDK